MQNTALIFHIPISTPFSFMNVLFVIPTLGGGGAEILLGAIGEELVRQGHSVKFVCLRPHHETYKTFRNLDFVERYIKPAVISYKVNFRLFRGVYIENGEYVDIIKTFKPDVIHAHLYEACLLAFSHIDPTIKYVVHFHDNMPQIRRLMADTFFSKNKITNLYESSWLKKQFRYTNPYFIAISNDTLKYVRANISGRHKKFLLHNAVDLRFFHSNTQKNATFSIVTIGNLVPKKGYDLLLLTAQELKKRNLVFRWDILGYGPLFDSLERDINNYGLQNMVFLNGSVKNVDEFLANAHLYAHFASYEPFGLVLLEAMASSLPVVCTDGLGNRDIIKEGENGFMVWERNPIMMADKIEFLYKNEARRVSMGKNALDFAQRFGIEKYVQKLIDIYRS